MNSKISIIIPVYNGSKTIDKTINSVLDQTYNNFEIVVIDDGSIDNTKNVVQNIIKEDNRVKYFYQENGGVSKARNTGIEKSTGEYICFLDADDYYNNEFLFKMYNRIYEENCDICYCGYNIVKEGKIYKRNTKFKKNDILIDYILEKTIIHTTCWMIKKDFLNNKNLRFREGVSWGEDFDLFCSMLSNTNKVIFVNEYLTNYVIGHNENQLSNFSLEKLDKDYEVIIRLNSNTKINKNKIINKALLDYRLSALLTYRINEAIQKNISKNEIRRYYSKYKEYLEKLKWNNGLRSIKLNIYKLLIKIKII